MSDTPAAFLPFAPTPDRDSRPYWDALAQGRFELQRCQACRALRWPAREICNRCRSFENSWEEHDGQGCVASWVRTHQAFAPALRDAVPYTVVQVRLDAQDDLLLIGGWLAARTPRFEEPVSMQLLAGSDGHHLPCWGPAEDLPA
jgi:hypothetical protein